MKRFGIDVGGTFTDIVIYDEASRRIERLKVLTTPEGPEKGILDAFAEAGLRPQDIAHLIHGTTLVTNLIIERKGARVGLITTEGYRDILEIMRAAREIPYDLHWQQPRPVVPRRLRLEVRERIDARGQVVTPLDEASVRAAVAELLRLEVEVIAICFLHAYANPAHELRAREIVEQLAPGMALSISSEVCPQIREYERTSTTVLNGYAMPRVDRYVRTLDAGLEIQGGIKYMNSEAGLLPSSEARRLPMTLCLSGPAGGVLAGQHVGLAAGIDQMITMDMGGTSLDVCVIRGGQAELADTLYVEWGIPIKTPALDVKTIGAGGGSIVWIDDGGAIRVGPQSAGAVPGPACYGQGGTECTVTDANMILGILDPEHFASGRLALDGARSLAAIQPIADHLGLAPEATAEGIYRIVNANIAAAVRQVTVERGLDPRDFTLCAFGGAGGQHAVAVAQEIGIPEVMLPNVPSVFSAFGMVTADMRHSRSRSLMAPLDDQTLAAATPLFEELERDVVQRLEAEPAVEAVECRRAAHLRYEKQAHEIAVDLLPEDTAAGLYRRFEARHKELYGTALGHQVVIVTLRTAIVGRVARIELERHPPGPETEPPIARHARVHPHAEPIPVIRRPELKAGMVVPAPALIEEVDSVHYLPPGCRAQVDEWLNLRIAILESPAP
jgi:N-methylhydantoinase A